jgi:hypothetical protein
MFRRVRNKMLVVSLCLGAAGILACAGALFDGLVAEGSILSFLAATVPLGLAIVGVLMGFAWACETSERYFSRRAGRQAARSPRFRSQPKPTPYEAPHTRKKWHGQ